MSTLAIAEKKADVMASLRRLDGRGTVGDIVADSGLSADGVRAALKELLESHRGHLAVSDSGELLYEFDRRFIERGTEPFLARAKRAVTKAVTSGFKAWIVVMLVVYFAVFVVLVIAALLASQRGDDSRGGWGGGRSRHGHLPNFWFWYWIWGPRWRIGRPYYGHRWERTLDKGDKVPFYKKVFAFVFGPDRPTPSPQQLDRRTLRLIRARNGVLTTAELVEHTGDRFEEAESEMGRLLGAYDGEATVSPSGEVVYAFPGLMVTAHERTPPREPPPSWLRLERPRELTGNTPGANTVVAGMNAFTLLAASTAPWFIFPRLGIGGPAAFFGLVIVPIVFSVLFFAGPLVRMAGVAVENRARARRNVRRVLLGLVYRRTLEGGAPVTVEEAQTFVRSRLGDEAPGTEAVERELHALATELEADVSSDAEGRITYAFPRVREQYAAGESVRERLRLDRLSLGEIVFSTSDTSEEATERDLALFDRQLAGEEPDLERYLPAVDRVDFVEDFELVAFEDELRTRPSVR